MDELKDKLFYTSLCVICFIVGAILGNVAPFNPQPKKQPIIIYKVDNAGAEIARHHERIAKKYHSDHSKKIKEIISSLKELGREKDIESEIMSFKNSQNFPEIPYLEGELLQDYLNDIRLADQYAALSRQVMLHNIATEMGWEISRNTQGIYTSA